MDQTGELLKFTSNSIDRGTGRGVKGDRPCEGPRERVSCSRLRTCLAFRRPVGTEILHYPRKRNLEQYTATVASSGVVGR